MTLARPDTLHCLSSCSVAYPRTIEPPTPHSWTWRGSMARPPIKTLRLSPLPPKEPRILKLLALTTLWVDFRGRESGGGEQHTHLFTWLFKQPGQSMFSTDCLCYLNVAEWSRMHAQRLLSSSTIRRALLLLQTLYRWQSHRTWILIFRPWPLPVKHLR